MTPPPKTWNELLGWQRAWFERGFKAGWPRAGEPYTTPEQAYNFSIKENA